MRLSKIQCVLCALIAVALALPVGVLGGGSGTKTSQVKEWTVMIYWDADNNLEFTTENKMSTWESSLSSNANVNIVALVDLNSINGIWIYDFEGGARKLVATWPEMNMSDPLVLEKFVQFSMDNFPAKKTMLVLGDHGYAWRGVCKDETTGNTLMSLHQIANALMDIKTANNGNGVDIISFDACNMASVEMAYELRNVASILLASETTVPFDGLPYQMFITQLVATPGMTPTQLSTAIVHDYVVFYGSRLDYAHLKKYSQDFVTMSAFDLSKTAAMGPAFAKMTGLLEPLIQTDIGQVNAARGYALIGTWLNMANYEYDPDAWAFFDGLRGIDSALDASVSEWEASFSAALLAEDHSNKYHDSVHGLNINFPPSLSHYNSVSFPWGSQFVYTQVGLDLIEESSWNGCLMAYYGSNK